MTTTDRTEELSLVRCAQRGDADAFRRLVDLYDRRLLYFVRRFLKDSDRGLDVLQEIWLTMLRRLHSLRSPEAFRVWLYQIAHDRVVDVVRRTVREERLQQMAFENFAERNGDDPAWTFEQAEFVHSALEQLTPEHREVLVLRFLEDMTLEEIAATVGCSPGTVKSRLHYARLAVRREAERLGHE